MNTTFDFNPRDSRFADSARRLRNAFDRVSGAAVPVVEPGGYARKFSTKQRLEDFEKMAVDAVGWANAQAANGSDWLPFLDTFVDVVMIAEAFGCEVVYTEGADPWCTAALPDISGVWNLKPAPLGTSYMVRRLNEWVDYAQRHLGTDVPLWTVDVQSPFSVAAHIVEPTELMMACVTDPKAVHHLVNMVAEYSIQQMQQHIQQMEHPNFPGRNYPSISDNIGICIADDTPLIMLSPEMYREFALPYNSMVSRALGGCHIHSCGNYSHNMDNLLRIDGVRSVQFHAGEGEYPLPRNATDDAAVNRARRNMTCLVDVNDISRGDAWRGRAREHYTHYVLDRLFTGDTTGHIFQPPGGGNVPACQEAVAWTRQELAKRGAKVE
ncbi:MAG: uroporphyrinogen decarboxylase family protein [Phycisphaerae bacterium]|nr:uroporphyrinogen decarboxylase family protein [Phycisphaerae bacterium]